MDSNPEKHKTLSHQSDSMPESSGGRGVTIISRHPNHRASTENAPGPSSTSAADEPASTMQYNFDTRPPGNSPGKIANNMPAASSVAKNDTTGVTSPMISNTPNAIAIPPWRRTHFDGLVDRAHPQLEIDFRLRTGVQPELDHLFFESACGGSDFIFPRQKIRRREEAFPVGSQGARTCRRGVSKDQHSLRNGCAGWVSDSAGNSASRHLRLHGQATENRQGNAGGKSAQAHIGLRVE